MSDTALADIRLLTMAQEAAEHNPRALRLRHMTHSEIDPWEVVNQAMSVAAEAQRKVTEQQARIARLERLLIRDELTGLANRRGFYDALHKALNYAERYDESGVIVFIDLDEFKEVNDTFGHETGDAVLCQVGRTLLQNVRISDTVARLGGDEFALLLVRALQSDALERANDIHGVLNSTVLRLGAHVVPVRASLGAVPFYAGEDPENIIRRADQEMYRDKRTRLQDRSLLN